MREIVLDTETTGLDPAAGHRVVEVGCIELFNHVPTGRSFHSYINPERDMPEEAFRIHKLSEAFLRDKPVFAEIADPLVDFLADARLVIHNAEFDLRFLNAELARLDRAPIDMARAVDTVKLARQRFPGAQASLDALCRRFEIDIAVREADGHGALLDSELLAAVYLELVGGRQPGLELVDSTRPVQAEAGAPRPRRPPRPEIPGAAPTDAERAAHAAFLARLQKPIWKA